ncbi:hypothetical protein EV702DRAFT_1045058 [Suillus placidus]|uniref:Uncharacterized protein n=1 Tax=Suillus placidus TaxID=48579 RepID=A0A9P7D3E1_9AGAM|nr:hypothetical protein EV702DRAFT_1045058 [Suillus placidus]
MHASDIYLDQLNLFGTEWVFEKGNEEAVDRFPRLKFSLAPFDGMMGFGSHFVTSLYNGFAAAAGKHAAQQPCGYLDGKLALPTTMSLLRHASITQGFVEPHQGSTKRQILKISGKPGAVSGHSKLYPVFVHKCSLNAMLHALLYIATGRSGVNATRNSYGIPARKERTEIRERSFKVALALRVVGVTPVVPSAQRGRLIGRLIVGPLLSDSNSARTSQDESVRGNNPNRFSLLKDTGSSTAHVVFQLVCKARTS